MTEWKPPSEREALENIRELAGPRQALTLHEAMSLIRDIWHIANDTIEEIDKGWTD